MDDEFPMNLVFLSLTAPDLGSLVTHSVMPDFQLTGIESSPRILAIVYLPSDVTNVPLADVVQ